MRKNLKLLLVFIAISCNAQNKVGEKVPKYIFTEILNNNKKSFDTDKQKKPYIIEFWATWCAPCIPAMKKLENIQKKYGENLEIITVSTDSRKNLSRYIENTKTNLKIAFDTIHLSVFKYKNIPHTILVDKNGYIKAVTTPDKISDEILSDLIAGKEINIVSQEYLSKSNFVLDKEFKNNDYQFKLTSENKQLSFKNEIKKNEKGEPVSLEFNNVSIYRLLFDIYQLSSVSKIYEEKPFSNKNKYCFKLEQSTNFDKKLLENAKEILNQNLEIKAQLVEKTIDSLYVLEISDKTNFPKASTEKEKYYEFHGPSYKGRKITSYNLIEYLENEIQKPIKDKTNLDFDFDIELNWSYTDKKSLDEELKKYGFVLKKSSVPEKITLLELK